MNTPLPMAGMTMHAPSAVHILREDDPATSGRIHSPRAGGLVLWSSAARQLYYRRTPYGCFACQHISSSLQPSIVEEFRLTSSPTRSYSTRNQPSCLQQVSLDLAQSAAGSPFASRDPAN